MTVKELSQLKFLNKEILLEKQRLLSLRSTSDCVKVDGIGTVKKKYFTKEISMLEKRIDSHLKECFALYEKIDSFINSVDDALVRLILSLRFINGLDWKQIALHIGGGNTADGVRKICERFLEKCEKRLPV